MGIYDREYYQDDQAPQGLNAGANWTMVTKLIVVNIVVFVADLFVGRNHELMLEWLAASPDSLREPWKCWQLLTYGFAHDPEKIGHIFWNMLALFFFGRALEAMYGAKEFLRIYLVTVVLGGLVFALRQMALFGAEANTPVIGASGAVTAVTLLYCIHFPKNTILLMMVIPVPAWFVGAMVIFGNLFGMMDPYARVAFDVHLVGAVLALCYFKFGWNFGRWMPGFSTPKDMFKRKPKLRVHSPPPDEDYEDTYDGLDEEGDRVLEKLNRSGIDSLSPREKKVLEDYSRRMRQKHR